jgi:hypothetical protein
MSILKEKIDDINQFEKEKLCNLLESDSLELKHIFDKAESIVDSNNTIYCVLLKILQQGNNVREAALSGIICGKIMGYIEAENKLELDIKDKLFNAFKNNI